MQLSDAGASVVSALNGQIAVDLATTQPFDLILMDMQMPIMGGYAATAELRRRGVTIPIIALTAYAMAEDQAKCLAIGCNGYLSKPVTEDELLTAVNRYLGKPVPNDGKKDIALSMLPVSAASGSEQIQSSLAGDPRMMEIIPGYVERLPGKVHKMLDLLAHNDLVELQRVVHDLLGTAGGYGFSLVSQVARKSPSIDPDRRAFWSRSPSKSNRWSILSAGSKDTTSLKRSLRLLHELGGPALPPEQD